MWEGAGQLGRSISIFCILGEGPKLCPTPPVAGQSTWISPLSDPDLRQVTTQRFCESSAPAVTVQVLAIQAEVPSVLSSDPVIQIGCIFNWSVPLQRALPF